MHIGFIMDGNGRWATARGKKRSAGHREGAKNVDRVVRAAQKMGVDVISLYAFSTENWKRPKEEVDTLFDLLAHFIKDRKKEVLKNGIVFRTMGDLSRLPKNLQDDIQSLTQQTKDNKGLTLVIAVNYGGRDEIVRAAKNILESGMDCTDQALSDALYSNGLPDPDLIIRTGGQKRLSNFMLWQAAYSELYFTDTLWPDFDEEQLAKALEDFYGRKRNFGSV